MHKDMEERAIVIGVAQTFGQAFIAWVPGRISFAFHDISLLILSSSHLECWQIRTKIPHGFQCDEWCQRSRVRQYFHYPLLRQMGGEKNRSSRISFLESQQDSYR